LAFIRLAGTIHTLASRSTSSHVRSRSREDDELQQRPGHIRSIAAQPALYERGDIAPGHGWLMLCPLSFARLPRQQVVHNIDWIALDEFLSPTPLDHCVAALLHPGRRLWLF
jgi:hypothetical protein